MSINNEINSELRVSAINFLKKIKTLSELEVLDTEIGIYNATIDYCNKKKIPLHWDDIHFRNIYKNSTKF